MTAHLLLVEWMNREGLNPVDVAKQLRAAARKHRLIDAPEKPPTRLVKRWLQGGEPHEKYKVLLATISGGYIPRKAWQ